MQAEWVYEHIPSSQQGENLCAAAQHKFTYRLFIAINTMIKLVSSKTRWNKSLSLKVSCVILRSGLRLIHNLSILYGMCVIQQDETVLFSVSISFIQDFNLLHDHCLPVRNHSPGVKVVPQELTSLILVRFDDSMHSHLLIFFSLCVDNPKFLFSRTEDL